MEAEVLVEEFSECLESRPSVILCLSGKTQIEKAVRAKGLNAKVKSIDFNHAGWSEGLIARSKVKDEEINFNEGAHVIKTPSKHIGKSRRLDESELEDVLALFFLQHKRDFMLSEKNFFLVVQETVHTGRSLQTVKNALIKNKIPEKRVLTVGLRTSMNPLVPPDVSVQKTFLKAPEPKEPNAWIRVGYGEEDLVLKIPFEEAI